MNRRASPGTLAPFSKIETRLSSALGAIGNIAAIVVLLIVMLAGLSVPSEARPTGGPQSPGRAESAAQVATSTHRVMLSLIMRSAKVEDSCPGAPACVVVVRVEDAGGNPIANAQIVGLYTDNEGQTTSMSRVTDENGEAVFPRSIDGTTEITFEVQFPVGVLPCSPVRILFVDGVPVRFIGCRV